MQAYLYNWPDIVITDLQTHNIWVKQKSGVILHKHGDLKGPHFELNINILKINGSTSRLSIIT